MIRPGFLSASAVACVLGWAVAYGSGLPFQAIYALWTLLLALLLHAAANVINDVADAQNGGDAMNQEAIAPFTGGAGLLQSGQVTLAQTRKLALILLVSALLGGCVLASQINWGLLWCGAAGAVLAWGYSAPPLQLMRRGVGELAVAIAWVLMVGGADFVQRGDFSPLAVVLGSSYALLMANVLLVNGLPDAKSRCSGGQTHASGALRRLSCARVVCLLAVACSWFSVVSGMALWPRCLGAVAAGVCRLIVCCMVAIACSLSAYKAAIHGSRRQAKPAFGDCADDCGSAVAWPAFVCGFVPRLS
jgi:1,4-dihydroxy-2-naphthoate octaprenyltransferase